MFQQDVLSLEEAQSAVAAMLEKGKSYRGPIAVAVVDASTHSSHSRGWTAAPFTQRFCLQESFHRRLLQRQHQRYCEENARPAAPRREYGNDKVLFLSGGVVVKRPGNRQVLGGIGVSGLSGEEDEEIALAGLKVMALT